MNNNKQLINATNYALIPSWEVNMALENRPALPMEIIPPRLDGIPLHASELEDEYILSRFNRGFDSFSNEKFKSNITQAANLKRAIIIMSGLCIGLILIRYMHSNRQFVTYV